MNELPRLPMSPFYSPDGQAHNNPVPRCEYTIVRGIIATSDRCLTTISESMKQRGPNDIALCEAQNEHRRFRLYHQRLISAVTRLPEDILVEIFAWAVNDGSNFRATPWKLAHVSARWRQILLSVSMFWSFITLDLTKIEDGDEAAISMTRSRLSEQLRRTGGHALHVRVLDLETQHRRPAKRAGPYHEEKHELFKLLLAQSERWLYADLHLAYEYHYDMEERADHFPILQYARWHFQKIDGTFEDVTCFRAATVLKAIAMTQSIGYTVQLPPSVELVTTWRKRTIYYGLTCSF